MEKREITTKQIEAAEKCLIDNGIDIDEAKTVLQALGYILLDTELYEPSEKGMCVAENEGNQIVRVQVQQVRYGYIPVEVADDFMENLNATSKRSRILKARKIAADALHEAPEKVVWNEPEDIYPTGSIF